MRVRLARQVVGFLVVAACSTSVACSTSGAAPDAGSVADAAGQGREAGPSADASAGADAGGELDAGSFDLCRALHAFGATCGGEADLLCGPEKFDAWCARNDEAINSDAFRRAEQRCLVAANCEGTKRRDCKFRSYTNQTPSPAQRSLVASYCARCEPHDAAACAARAIAYDPARGPDSVTDIFVAAWEFNDGVTDEIRRRCTEEGADAGADAGDAGAGGADGGDAGTDGAGGGDAGTSAADGGGDAGAADAGAAACATAFGRCAGDVYFERLPDCPP